jgi:hypothetical protein
LHPRLGSRYTYGKCANDRLGDGRVADEHPTVFKNLSLQLNWAAAVEMAPVLINKLARDSILFRTDFQRRRIAELLLAPGDPFYFFSLDLTGLSCSLCEKPVE